MFAKTLPYQPLQAVAGYRLFYLFARDGQTQAWMSQIIGACDQQKIFTFNTSGRPEYLTELVRVIDPVASGETSGDRRHDRKDYTVRRLRPLALRDLITFLPPRVRILIRKPCWRFLLILLG